MDNNELESAKDEIEEKESVEIKEKESAKEVEKESVEIKEKESAKEVEQEETEEKEESSEKTKVIQPEDYDITGDDSRILIYRPDKEGPVSGQLDHPISHGAHHLPWYKEIYHLIYSELSGSTEEVSKLWEQALQVNRAIISLHQTMN